MADTLPQPEKRKPLSKYEFAVLFLQQSGKCGCCSTRLERGQIIDEHLVPLDHLGTNDLSNRALWCKPCAKEKTKRDLAASWKGKRIRQETGQGPKAQIRSRGFQKGLRRKFNGTVERVEV